MAPYPYLRRRQVCGRMDVTTRTEKSAVPDVAWFCIRSQIKHEHIAASHLSKMEGVEAFSPRIRFKRSTRNGPVLVTESLFPNYLFARFDWRTSLARVHYAPGVSTVVHFGTHWPIVPDQVIEELRASLGPEALHIADTELTPGEEISISGSAFHGLQAVVKMVMPGRKRVMVLLDFMGRQSTVEVPLSAVVKKGAWR